MTAPVQVLQCVSDQRGGVDIESPESGMRAHLTRAEWEQFRADVKAGLYDDQPAAGVTR